jgi:hypothetical protein
MCDTLLNLGKGGQFEYHGAMSTTSYVLMAVGAALIIIYFIVKKTQKN